MSDDDRFERFLAEAARQYRQPPETPREEMWRAIQAARRAGRDEPAEVVDLTRRLRPARRWLAPVAAIAAIAAVLVIGIGIGRLSTRANPGTVAARTGAAADSASLRRTETVMRFAAAEHFSRIEALLTDFETGATGADFQANAKDLLAKTRLLLDSKQLVDPRLRALLEDLELVLVQVAQVSPSRAGEERRLIDEGITERRVRLRLRNAIPAGPSA